MNTNGKITAPVNLIADVGPVLGVSSTNLSVLCASDKINKWSRYKPVHIVNAMAVDRNTLWYRGTNNDCGLTPVSTNSYSQLPNLYDTGAAEWSYSPPWGDRGGTVKSPYRLADFDKYDNNAIPPIGDFSCPSEVRQNGTFSCDVIMNSTAVDENEYKKAGSLTLNEIYIGGEKLSNWYFGCLITNTSGGIAILAAGYKPADGPFGHGFPTFRTNSLLLNNTYYVYPFLAKNPQEQGKPAVANTFLTIPNGSRGKIKIVSGSELDGISIILKAEYEYITNVDNTKQKIGISGEFTVKCEKGSKTFTNNYLMYRHSTSSSLQMGEGQTKLEDFTVSGNGGTYTKTFAFDIPMAYRDKNYVVTLSLQNGNYIEKAVPLADGGMVL